MALACKPFSGWIEVNCNTYKLHILIDLQFVSGARAINPCASSSKQVRPSLAVTLYKFNKLYTCPMSLDTLELYSKYSMPLMNRLTL